MLDNINRVRTFKLIRPEGNGGLSNAEILDLFNKWYADNPHITGAEAGYQIALYMKKLKASLNSKSQSVGV